MSTRLSKYYVYKVLFSRLNFLKKDKDKNFTVNDFGCGDGMLLRYYDFDNYIGIDLNKSKINKLKKKFNSKKISFQNKDIIYFRKSLKSKISICMETFGFNTKFKKKVFLMCIKNILKHTQKNGFLFFNITRDLDSIDLNNLLKKNFHNVYRINYGFFNERIPFFLARFFWWLEYLFPSNKNFFFSCKNKI